MSSVFKRGGMYVVKWKDGTGTWRQLRTSATMLAEARRLAADLDRKAERQRAGLDPVVEAPVLLTFAELIDLWWDEYGSNRRSKTVKPFADKHLRAPLGKLLLAEVTPARIESLLNTKAAELAPKSLNHLLALVRMLFSIATLFGRWAGPNPAAAVKRRKVPKKLPVYLKTDEVPLLLGALAPKWRALFATAVFTGMRKGELLGLRKRDVDLAAGTIAVCRSYDAPTTKGSRESLIPIAEGVS
jgi:integrase